MIPKSVSLYKVPIHKVTFNGKEVRKMKQLVSSIGIFGRAISIVNNTMFRISIGSFTVVTSHHVAKVQRTISLKAIERLSLLPKSCL
jgi:hypothetical protein